MCYNSFVIFVCIKEKFEQVRNSELAEVQRMEAEQIRLFEEKVRCNSGNKFFLPQLATLKLS